MSGEIPTSSTEFVRLDQPTLPGPELPEAFAEHCMTKITEDLVVLIGKAGLIIALSCGQKFFIIFIYRG